MTITVAVFSILILLFFLISLCRKTNNHNKHQLVYLHLHLGCIAAALIIYVGIEYKILSNHFFVLIIGSHISNLTFLLLHVRSVLKESQAKITYVHFLPILAFCVVCLLNYFDIYLLNFSTRQDVFVNLKIEDKRLLSDAFFLRGIITVILIIMIFRTSVKHFKNIQEKKKTYRFWIYIYLSVILIAVFISTVYYFGVLNPKFDPLLMLLSRAFISLSILSFALNPVNPLLIPLLTKTTAPTLDDNKGVFKEINELMLNEELFLIKNIETNVICNKTGFDKKTVLSAILNNAKGNWKAYINDLRVEYAIQLLKTDYLKQRSIVSLGEKSGFNSSQSFFRAFKLKTNMTPGQFYKKSVKTE